MSDPQPWLTLEAGEMLDVWVASRLGLKVIYGVIVHWTEDCHRAIDTCHYTEADGIPHSLKAYSTDLNAAFTLFSTEPGLEWNLFSEDDEWITCELGHFAERSTPDLEQATEKEAALAIVRAWLKWQEREDHA